MINPGKFSIVLNVIVAGLEQKRKGHKCPVRDKLVDCPGNDKRGTMSKAILPVGQAQHMLAVATLSWQAVTRSQFY